MTRDKYSCTEAEFEAGFQREADRLDVPRKIDVAHLDGRGGIYWMPATRTTEPSPDLLRPGHDRFSYAIDDPPERWRGIPFGCCSVDGRGSKWRPRQPTTEAEANDREHDALHYRGDYGVDR